MELKDKESDSMKLNKKNSNNNKRNSAYSNNTNSININKDDLKVEILPDDYNHFDFNFKLIVIGDSGVGKSCLTMKATKDIFDNHYSATVGFEFFTFNSKINEKVVKLQIWDTCGQEIYRSLIANFYRNSALAILVYSIDSIESFQNLDYWIKDLRSMANPDIRIFLIGSKADLESERQVSKELSEEFVTNNNIDFFIETSAKTGFNISKCFIEAGKLLYIDSLKYKQSNNGSRLNSSSIQDSTLNPYNNSSIRVPMNNNNNNSNKYSLDKDGIKKKKGCC